MGQREWCFDYSCHFNSQLTGGMGGVSCNGLISKEIYPFSSYHFPFKETRGLFSAWCWCGLCWMIGVTDELFTGENISRRIVVLPCFRAKDIIKPYARRKFPYVRKPYHHFMSYSGKIYVRIDFGYKPSLFGI